MKTIYTYITALLIIILAQSCQNDLDDANVGYLRMEVEAAGITHSPTRVAENYNPKQLAVEIVNEQGEVMESTDDHTTWANRQFRLVPGIYTVKASSYNFDGQESGFGIPYYYGETQVTVEEAKVVTAEVTCTLANVKVTVNFDESFTKVFKAATATVSSGVKDVKPQTFVMGENTPSAYFPVGSLTSEIKVTNMRDQEFSAKKTIAGVKARDHYILNYKVADTGEGSIKVEADGTEKTYTFYFPVSTEAKTSLKMNEVNAWSTFAYLTGGIENLEAGKVLDASKMSFEYKTADAVEWTTVAAVPEENDEQQFSAKLTNLTPKTAYQCRISYVNGEENYISKEVDFTTEDAPELINGKMDDWYQDGKTWYPISESYFKTNGGSYWDSSNPGTTKDAGALVNKNPTQGNSETVHTSGGKSAQMDSQYASAFGIGKFAAGSLYTGHFVKLQGTNGAIISFGQPFTARPSKFHGFYHYTSGVIDYKGDNTPAEANIVKGQTQDQCAIYIALTTKEHVVDNTVLSSFVDWDNDESVIAYGEIPASEAGTTDGWKEFNIDLKYRNLHKKPTHIIIVCSSSKYGDYFTGSTNSMLYVDDMELIYGEPTK